MKGYFRKRGDKWSFTLDVGKDELTGKRKQKTKSGFKTKKEAEKACAELIAQVENENYMEETEQKYGDYLINYMETITKHQVRPTTYNLQHFIATKHILPAIGHLKIKKIKPEHLQRMYTEKKDEGLSGAYIRTMHAIINKSLRKAVEWGKIKQNIATVVTPPRIEKAKTNTWTQKQSIQFLQAIKSRKFKSRKFYMAYVLAIYCGLRKGEILGLPWTNCDFENGYITIKQTLAKVRGQLFLQEPKTKGSVRKIKISSIVVQALMDHKKYQDEIKDHNPEYNDIDLVVANLNGTMIDPADLNRDFSAACAFAEVPTIRFHDLRHTHATLLLQLGENPKVVSERLGHADVSITLNTYSHVLPDMQESLVHNFELAMRQDMVDE